MPRLLTAVAVTLSLALLEGCGDGHDHAHDGHHHDHDHSGPNDHVWMDPVGAKRFIEGIGPVLAEVIDAGKVSNRKPIIVASIHPLTSLLREVVGEAAEVRTMLPQGSSPHGFEVTPEVVRTLGKADLVVIVGRKLDPWAEKAAKNLGRSDVKLVRLIELVEAVEENRIQPLSAEHALSPRLRSVVTKLETMHDRFAAALAQVKTKELVTFHNAFDLLATRYGLKVVAHLTEMDLPTGAEVTPQQLREVKDAVKEHGLKVLYAEPQYPEQALRAIQEATGVSILRLDDIGGPDRPGYATYFEMMESNVKTLIEGQSR
ncbi:MAG: zinc ABC transporter substrate-binding protein [Phycisphaeraceae bacterium]